jgi:hypothetical protein
MLNIDFDLFWQILSGSGDPVGSMQLRPWCWIPREARLRQADPTPNPHGLALGTEEAGRAGAGGD